jgi:hypothetical protein
MPDMPPLRIKGNESVPLTWFQADGYVLTGLPAEWDRPGPVGAGRAAAEGLLRDRERDRKLAMLTCLSQHRWLTTTQVEALFFTYIRGAQRNLRRLEEWGLIHRGHRMDPNTGAANWRKYPDLFLLSARGAWVLAHSQRTDPQPFISRAFNAFNYRLHILHAVGVNDFFATLVRASRGLNEGLYHWVGDDGVRRTFQERGEDVAPDGWGRYLTEAAEIYFYLEWDRGTEPPARLRAKAAAADKAGAGHVLWVAPRPARETALRSVLQASKSERPAWTTHVGLLQEHGPLSGIWQPSPGGGRRQRLAELPGQPRTDRQLEDCLGRPGWWKRRPGGTEGM